MLPVTVTRKAGIFLNRLHWGRGLVGQAALEGKPITLRNIPEYAKVSFGFGQASPEEILLIPLIYNDQTVGVLELGSFKSFSESHLNWLEEAARSISVVLRSNLANSGKAFVGAVPRTAL